MQPARFQAVRLNKEGRAIAGSYTEVAEVRRDTSMQVLIIGKADSTGHVTNIWISEALVKLIKAM